MSDSDLMFRPATELAGMVRSGELSARELVQTSLERIEELNPQLERVRRGRRRAARSPRPTRSAGRRAPVRGRADRDQEQPRRSGAAADLRLLADGRLRRRLRPQRRRAGCSDAGFVIVGTTTLPEYGILPVSEARIFGPTRNPWDLERTPGGSSGGAAAAVAAGMVPVAHGNDGGGSIRIPAACCGLVGLKPSRGRISVGARLGRLLARDRRRAHPHRRRHRGDPRRARRLRAGRRHLGAAAGRAVRAAAPARDAGTAADRARRRCRRSRTRPSTRVRAAVADAAALLRSLGHEVEEVDPPWQADGLQRAVRRGLLQPHRAVDRLLGHGRRARADGARTWSR